MKKSGITRKTPLKRSTKPLAFRSKTNSRREENVALRKEYHRQFPRCELWDLLTQTGIAAWEQFKRAWIDARGIKWCLTQTAVHHIFHVGTRPDVITNFATASNAAHSFIHDKEPRNGTIICVWMKRNKGELSDGELFDACGVRLCGWLESRESENPVVEEFRQTLICELRTAA